MLEVKYKLVNLEEVEHSIDPSLEVMCDTETIGLYGRIRLIQFYQKGWDTALLVENPNPFALVKLFKAATYVFHNAHYDISCIQENIGKMSWTPDNYHCTFMLGRLHFYKEESFSLDDIISYVIGHNPYQTKKKEMQASDWNVPVLSEEQLNYAASDVMYLQYVWEVVREQLDNINYKLDMLTLGYCLDFQNNGMPVDIAKLQKKYKENMEEIAKAGLTINCNSYQQVRAYINSSMSDDIGLAVLSAQGNEKAALVRKVRKLTKNNSFLTKFQNTLEETSPGFGVIYGKFKKSARSGRTASDDQNLQQLPRSLKGIFGVDPEGDEAIYFSDFAQIQLRNVCVVTGDKTMEKLFRSGADMHNFVAEMIFGQSFTPEHRQICKTANFGLLFGAGIVVFISILLKDTGMWLKESEALSLKKKWLSLWKEIADWQTKGIKAWKKGEVWETPLGRRYKSKMMTDQLAMQIQGFEAEVATLAMHYMLPKLEELSTKNPGAPKIKLRNFVHDSYIFTGPKDPEIYKVACDIIASSMQEAWAEMCQSVKITDLPMPTKVRVGYNWGDIEKGVYEYELSK